MSTTDAGSIAKRAKVEDSVSAAAVSSSECKDFKLHLTNIPSHALGECHLGKAVYVCKQSDLIKTVTKFMIDKNISSVPVLTVKHNKHFGWIDWVPILEYVIAHFTKEKASGVEVEDKTFLELMEDSAHFQTLTVHDVMKYPRTNANPFHPVRACYSAFAVVEALAKDPQLQRICVINDDRTVVNIVTQTDVVGYICKHLDLLSDGKKAKTLNLCQNLIKPVVTVNESDTVFDAFAKINAAQVHGAAIVTTNENGERITGNLSLRDLKNLGFGVEKYWRLHSMNVHNYMLHLRQETPKGSRPRSWVTVKPTDTLLHTVEKMHEHGLHHIYILNDDKIPIGVVSIRDLLVEFISQN